MILDKIEDFNKNKIKINPILAKLRQDPKAGKGENDFFTSFDGTKIFYRIWKPHNEIKKIIIVCHGMAGHGEFFVLLADKLIESDIMVISFDYRNHGRSHGKKGDLKKFKYIIKDLHYFYEFISDKYKNIPIFLFGESMGGAVIINYLKMFNKDVSKLSGIILMSPAIKLNFSRIQWIILILLAIFLFPIRIFFPSWTVIPAKGREELGIKNKIHQQYDKKDPMHLEKLSLRYILQLFKHIRKTPNLALYITMPIIIFHGDCDKGIDLTGTQKFYNHIASKDKKLIIVKEGYHALITDPSFQNKWSILIDWLKAH